MSSLFFFKKEDFIFVLVVKPEINMNKKNKILLIELEKKKLYIFNIICCYSFVKNSFKIKKKINKKISEI